MFLSEVPAALLRRWYIVALGLGLTAAIAVFVADKVEPEYTVTAQTLLLPPATSVPAGGNPYLSLGGLNAVGDILSEAIRDDTNLAALGFTGQENFDFSRDENSAAPMMIISVTAPTAETARSEANAILRRVPTALKELQTKTGVPADSLITSSVVVNPGQATASSRAQLRALLASSALGLALTVLLVAAFDRMLRARRLRRKARDEAAGHQSREAPVTDTPVVGATNGSNPTAEPLQSAPPEDGRPGASAIGTDRAEDASVRHHHRGRLRRRPSPTAEEELSDLDAELASDAPRV